MPKINGTFICLHSCSRTLSPYYNTLEFANRLCLADCFTGGDPPYRDSYIAVDNNEITQRLLTEGVPGKLFFVESNCAHNVSYFLSKCAYEQLNLAEEGQKFLIVNFDQHEDYEGVTQDLFCGNWGAHVCQTLRCDYLIVGRGQNKDALLINYVEGKKPIRQKGRKPADINNIISEYDKLYVTVDMDVLNGKETNIQRTNWVHGANKIEDLCSWLRGLPAGKIIAADITGFPPKRDKNGALVPPKKQGVQDGYLQDIVEVAKAICTPMGINYEIN